MEALPLLGFRDADMLRRTLSGKIRRYTYSTPVTNVTATGSIQATISVESASDFIARAMTARIFVTSTHRAVDHSVYPPARIEVIDQASGASLFDRADVFSISVFGQARRHLKLAVPHVFAARTVVTVVVNNVASVAFEFQVSLHGYKQKKVA